MPPSSNGLLERQRLMEAEYAIALYPDAGPLDADGLLRQAKAATGLRDWGGERWGEEGFRARLALLCGALENEAALSRRGRARAHSRLHVMLCSRLRFVDWSRRNDARPIGLAPLVGAGLPRAGTTFLHNLLAQDPDSLTATAAQAAMPLPPPGIDAQAEAARTALYRKILHLQGFLDADMTAIHPFAPDVPEECIFLQEGACSTLYGAFFNVPAFGAQAAAGIADAYAWQRGVMAALQFGQAGARWVLKAPSHLMYWDATMAAFPNARVFLNHRDPAKVIPSICSLFMKLRGLFSDQGTDPRELGPQLLSAWAAALERMTAWRAAHPETAIFDVHYKALIADPVGEAERLYAFFGLPLSGKTRDRMAAFLRRDHHAAAPRRDYGLADYGLTEADIEAAFGGYIGAYGIAREDRS